MGKKDITTITIPKGLIFFPSVMEITFDKIRLFMFSPKKRAGIKIFWYNKTLKYMGM